ncbi:flagellar basal-body rod protein FlgF [Candidatus Liberibacter sp.]|uniref:flagellar basal-body rod protein FlgF n=1 Tax=Candidatus Liberibacter sp. TaxID=34022 RepID=UPI0015F5EAD1|nr:flagellar basal-body rod protein FlgF [Candidatus Liberibacter sp.]MBA5723619.1 flagellar basal-body rod protein FlgF [Candidatus Liberibacter sp.]
MQSALNVALSAQVALEKRLTTVADNIANANNTGFRTIKVKFSEMLDSIKNDLGQNVSFVAKGDEYLSKQAGSFTQTENVLDFALEGEAWFALESPQGIILTRDGRFKIAENGELVSSSTGYPLLDVGGMPIQLHQKDEVLEVSNKGDVFQKSKRVGMIGLYSADLSKGFTRRENSSISPKIQPEPLLDRNDIMIKRGYLENSNTNSMFEMMQLFHLTRKFESVNTLIEDSERSLLEAVKNLAG